MPEHALASAPLYRSPPPRDPHDPTLCCLAVFVAAIAPARSFAAMRVRARCVASFNAAFSACSNARAGASGSATGAAIGAGVATGATGCAEGIVLGGWGRCAAASARPGAALAPVSASAGRSTSCVWQDAIKTRAAAQARACKNAPVQTHRRVPSHVRALLSQRAYPQHACARGQPASAL